ncbi:MAG: tetratricopeptide repeat protein [Candidatus Curtissbacteria bacterium]
MNLLTQIYRPTSPKATKGFNYAQLTHNLRNISRIVIAAGILAACIVFVVWEKTSPQVQSINEKLAAAPQDVGLRLSVAKRLEAEGRMEEAREQVLATLNFAPSDAYAIAVYREITAKSESLETDVLKMREILAIRPDYQKAWVKLATLYDYQGRDELAAEARQKADELAKKL